MKKHFYIILLAATAMIMQACGNFLEEESQSEVIPQTTEDFSELLIGSGYPDNNYPDMSILEYLDDDCAQMLNYSNSDYWSGIVYTADYYAGTSQAISPAPYYQWQPYECDFNGYQERINTSASGTMFYQYYNKIKGCNAVLDLIDDAVGTQEGRDRVKAEALAVRALLYFQLVNIYGQPYNYNKQAPGVPLKLDANLSDEPMQRATVAEVYEDVILPDLLKAAELMDPLEILTKNYRVNQPAIHILLSRVYLFMDEYQKCIDEVNKAMAQGIRVMNLTTEFNAADMSYNYNPLDYNNPEVLWIFGPGTRVGNVAYMSGMSPEFQSLWDVTNDIRYQMFGLYVRSYQNDNVFVMRKEYGNSALCQTIRTSEAVLNRMEAQAMLGQDVAALKALNDFRATRIRNYEDVSLSGEELLEAIRTERRKELCYEGFRWFDLRRYGMPEIHHDYRAEKGGQTVRYTLQHNDPMYTLPFPNSVIVNCEIEQNECRNGSDRTGVPVTE